MPTKLSVNINKIATLRNARGGNNPNLIKAAEDIIRFGAEGITVHPRPDERHIRYADVYELKKMLAAYPGIEFNIEGNPKEEKFVDLVVASQPHQVTLVPDTEGQLTSDHGWDTLANKEYLQELIPAFQKAGIRVSIFVDPDMAMVEGAKATGTDRIELYTEAYAKEAAGKIQHGCRNTGEEDKHAFHFREAIKPYILAAEKANELGIGINAGHDLDLHNLNFFAKHIPGLLEVSIGHALISDALYYGLENAVQLYKRQLAV